MTDGATDIFDITILPVWLQFLITTASQILFIYVRTLNIKYTADDKIWPAVWTSGLIGLFWLIAIYIGVSSLMQGHIMPAAGHLFGGMVGTYIGMKYDLLTKK